MSQVNLTFPVDELATALLAQLKPYLTKATAPEQITQPEYLTRKETKDKLKISLPTLNEYTKRGILKSYRVGARVLYKQCEIAAVLNPKNYGRANNV